MSVAVTIPSPRVSYRPKLALAAGATALGDWLFYGHRLGISIALFLFVLATVVVAGNVVRARGHSLLLAIGFLVAGLLPLVETLNALTWLLAATGLVLFATLAISDTACCLHVTLASALRLMILGPFRLLPDLISPVHRGPSGRPWLAVNALIGWAVPIVFCWLFTLLFMSANPLIDGWVSSVRWSILVDRIDGQRLILWALLLSLAWAFVMVRQRVASPRLPGLPERPRPEPANTTALSLLLSEATIRRSLILFNLLFAVQSVLDLTYLWGGVALPDAMTYATYAHRGAYPLIATALLAGGLVLAVMRPGSAGERAPIIRALVYLWVGQNVLLVTSSILRLDLYVATYSLTFMRIAAFTWMVLVAIGLVLIVLRIALRRSNAWLLGANGLAVVTTVYLCAFVNVAALIGDYNVAHSGDLGVGEQPFDVRYAMSLGPQAIPAVDRYLAVRPRPSADDVVRWRAAAAAEHAAAMTDWRGWTFRDWRLSRYLEQEAAGSSAGAVRSDLGNVR